MRLHVVFNENGDILAAAPLDSVAPVRVRPVADEQTGQRAASVGVPSEYAHYDLLAVGQRLRVSVEGRFPELRAKE